MLLEVWYWSVGEILALLMTYTGSIAIDFNRARIAPYLWMIWPNMPIKHLLYQNILGALHLGGFIHSSRHCEAEDLLPVAETLCDSRRGSAPVSRTVDQDSGDLGFCPQLYYWPAEWPGPSLCAIIFLPCLFRLQDVQDRGGLFHCAYTCALSSTMEPRFYCTVPSKLCGCAHAHRS